MPNYQNSKIYKIIDNTNGNNYIGSTTLALSKRLAHHRGAYKIFLRTDKGYITSFEILKNENFDIVLLEEVNCENKEQLHAKERHYIESIICIKYIPTRTREEYKETNKDIIIERNKKLYVLNKEKVQVRSKERYELNKKRYFRSTKKI